MVLSRSQHEEICYEAFSLAVMEKMNWGVSCSVCWGASWESIAVDQRRSVVSWTREQWKDLKYI